MSKDYQPSDKAYIGVSNREVSEVNIVKKNANLYEIKFTGGSGGLLVRGSRLFPSMKEANDSLPKEEEKKKKWISHSAFTCTGEK